jgi:hypothetical protein
MAFEMILVTTGLHYFIAMGKQGDMVKYAGVSHSDAFEEYLHALIFIGGSEGCSFSSQLDLTQKCNQRPIIDYQFKRVSITRFIASDACPRMMT